MKTSLVGLRIRGFEDTHWSYELGNAPSPAGPDDDAWTHLHKGYFKFLLVFLQIRRIPVNLRLQILEALVLVIHRGQIWEHI